jgi:hypothetical protein
MAKNNDPSYMNDPELMAFLHGKSEHTIALFHHFIQAFQKAGTVTVHPAKTMIGIANSHKRIAWITQLGKNFVHIVLPFPKPYEDNFCFQKIAQVPGDQKQFNHHLRIFFMDDVNDEVIGFMKLAYQS